MVEGIPLYLETAKPIFGNKITKNPRPLKEISPEDGSCVVWGDVFGFETRETRDGRSNIVTFNITDVHILTPVKSSTVRKYAKTLSIRSRTVSP